MTIDSIVRVTATIDPTAAAGPTFGRTLLLYPGQDLPDFWASGTAYGLGGEVIQGASVYRATAAHTSATGNVTNGAPDQAAATNWALISTVRALVSARYGRDSGVNVHDGAAAVRAAYASDHEAVEAGSVYFRQVPYPREFLTAGRFDSDAKTYVLGSAGFTGSTVLDGIKNNGSVTLTIEGNDVTVDLNVTGTGDTGFEAVATELQTEIRTITSSPDLSGTVVQYDAAADAFAIIVAAGIDITGAPSGAGAEAVGLDVGTASYYDGLDTETIAEALDRIQEADDSWYWLVLSADIADSALADDVSAWVQDSNKLAIIDVVGASVLTADESTSRAAGLADDETERLALIWSGTLDHKAASAAGRMAGTDFAAADSLPTLFAKALPGTAPDTLTAAQRAELDRKRINYYQTVAGFPIVRPGVTVRDGWWIDVRFWLDWLIKRVQDEVYTLLRQSPRIPLTLRGTGRLQAVIEDICEIGVRNGGIAPGKVSETTAGEIRQATTLAFDGTLSRGFLVHVGSVDDQSQADRDARKAPPISVWLKGSGAVHSVDIAISFTS